ncbi:19034_t:CDS:2 [Rhizophagus irregularis]|nr:19034_t:CDS:2 [Rhizophagus irregularis]
MDNMDNMDTTIIENEEEVSTWVINNKKTCMKAFFNPFYDIFDRFLVEVVKCKKIEEYIDLETMIIKSTSVSKPGKIPIRLNKPETKVPAVYYFLSLFLIKFAGVHVDSVVEFLLRREYTAAVSLKRIETRYSDLQKKFEDLEKKVENSADSALINGLVIIQDLENKIRNLEADVIAKERIILEKNETNNSLWEKIKEKKEEQPTSQATDMEIDKKTQKKKKRPTNKKRKRAQAIAKTGMITDLTSDIGRGLWIKKENDYIDDNGELQEGNRRYFYKSYAPRQYGFRREWEQQDFSYRHSAPSRRHNQW